MQITETRKRLSKGCSDEKDDESKHHGWAYVSDGYPIPVNQHLGDLEGYIYHDDLQSDPWNDLGHLEVDGDRTGGYGLVFENVKAMASPSLFAFLFTSSE